MVCGILSHMCSFVTHGNFGDLDTEKPKEHDYYIVYFIAIFILLLLLLTCPPISEVWLNQEVVMFQPLTGTSPYLGSVAIVNFIFYFLAPPVTTFFLIISPHPLALHPTASPSHPLEPLHSLCCTFFSPPTLLGAERLSTWTAPPPDGLHKSSLRLTPLMSVPWSSSPYACDWLVPHLIAPPFDALNLFPDPYQILGVLLYEVPFLPLPTYINLTPPLSASTGGPVPAVTEGFALCYLCPPIPCASVLSSLYSTPSLGVLWWLVLSSGVLFQKSASPGRLQSLDSARSSPHYRAAPTCKCRLGYPPPPTPTPQVMSKLKGWLENIIFTTELA